MYYSALAFQNFSDETFCNRSVHSSGVFSNFVGNLINFIVSQKNNL